MKIAGWVFLGFVLGAALLTAGAQDRQGSTRIEPATHSFAGENGAMGFTYWDPRSGSQTFRVVVIRDSKAYLLKFDTEAEGLRPDSVGRFSGLSK